MKRGLVRLWLLIVEKMHYSRGAVSSSTILDFGQLSPDKCAVHIMYVEGNVISCWETQVLSLRRNQTSLLIATLFVFTHGKGMTKGKHAANQSNAFSMAIPSLDQLNSSNDFPFLFNYLLQLLIKIICMNAI